MPYCSADRIARERGVVAGAQHRQHQRLGIEALCDMAVSQCSSSGEDAVPARESRFMTS
jgi:hypothetical protein